MKKPKVGQVLFLVSPQHRRGPITCEATVVKVGTEYFSVEYLNPMVFLDGSTAHRTTADFRLSDWKENSKYRYPDSLYKNEHAWNDENERIALMSQIRSAIRNLNAPKLTLDQARRIEAILKEAL